MSCLALCMLGAVGSRATPHSWHHTLTHTVHTLTPAHTLKTHITCAASFYSWMLFVIAVGILGASLLQQWAFAVMGQVRVGGSHT